MLGCRPARTRTARQHPRPLSPSSGAADRAWPSIEVPRAVIAAGRLPSPALAPGQWAAGHPRAAAGDRASSRWSCIVDAGWLREAQARRLLPDRPAARGGDAEPLGPGAGRGDRGRRRLDGGRLGLHLAARPRRGPAPGAGAPGRRGPPPGLPGRGRRLGQAADRGRAAKRPGRPGLPRRR